jgi:mono/diheme cytochrome c family protein
MTTRNSAQSRPSSTTWKQPQGFRLFETVKALLLGTTLLAPIALVGAGIMYYDYAGWKTAVASRELRMASLDRLLAAPPLQVLPVAAVERGRDVYATSCAACHSPTGRGVPGLGQDLIHSWFVASLDDSGLKEFIREGRRAESPDNVTGIPMPPGGGHDLSSEDLEHLVAYVRVLQDPRRVPRELEGQLVAEAKPAVMTDDDHARFLAAAGGDADRAAYLASGAALYANSCAACHGPEGRGIPGLGTALLNNPFCLENDEDFLVEFIKRGRDPSDPDNTTGVGMPARGGNPALDEDDILDIIDFIRALEHLTSTQR